MWSVRLSQNSEGVEINILIPEAYQPVVKSLCVCRSKLVNGLEFPSKAELEGCYFAVPHFDRESKGSPVSSFWATVLKNEVSACRAQHMSGRGLGVTNFLVQCNLILTCRMRLGSSSPRKT